MPQEQTVDRPKRWPLIILPENRGENTSTDAKLVNGFMEKELRGDFFLYKRPGLAKQMQLMGGVSPGRGVFNWLGDIYSIFGTTLFRNSDVIGTVDGTNGVYRFESSMGAVPKLQLGNGKKAYNFDHGGGLVEIEGTGGIVNAGSFKVDFNYTIATPGTTNFTLIGAVDNLTGTSFVATGVGTGTGNAIENNFPSNAVKGFAYLDATTYVMDVQANIRGSAAAQNKPELWPTDNTILVQIEPSRGVFLAKQLVYVIAFKESSTEVFYDAGNTVGSPLGRVQGAKVNWGAISGDSVQDIDGVLFWLATNRSAAVQVMKLDNLKVDIVSTPAIERLLSEVDFTAVYSFTVKYHGHRWYIFTLKNNNLTLAFDLLTGLWAQWTDVNGNYFPIVASTYNTVTAATILQHETNGWLYTVDSETGMDAEDLITVDIYTPNYDGESSRSKTCSVMYFDADQVVGSVLQVRFSDDDYKTWTGFRRVDLGQEKPYLDECGSFDKRRAIHLRHKSPTRFRIRAIDLQIDIGTL